MNATVSGVIIKDIRRFAGSHHIPLSRINLLVGDNSIAKSTLLGCVSALGHLANLKHLDDRENYFNQEPFCMGSFDTLVRSKCKFFQVGFEFANSSVHRLLLEFTRGDHGVLKEHSLEILLSNGHDKPCEKLEISRTPVGNREHWIFDGPEFNFSLDQGYTSYEQFTTWLSRGVRYGILPFFGDKNLYVTGLNPLEHEIVQFVKFVNYFRHVSTQLDLQLKLKAIEPHVLIPQRIFKRNPLRKIKDTSKFAELLTIGRKLGILEDIRLREVEDGFEINVTVDGKSHNIRDVGFGVSSVLPFLDAFVTAEEKTLFLMQQPEVHLHPQSQANMVKIMAQSKHSYMIETHSDHFVDWFRICVQKKKIMHSDVTILYFEKDPENPSATRVHPITLDEFGNLDGVPRGYRDFFTDEKWQLLGFERDD